MSSIEERFHEQWLGMVQPVDGLVVSIPVLVEAQCLARQPADLQRRLELLTIDAGGAAIDDIPGFLADILGWPPERQLAGDALPDALSLYVPEGAQLIKPTLALQAAIHGEPPVLLLWDLGAACVGLPLDKPETSTGTWEYPVAAKLDRLLRHARVPIGVLTNRAELRLVYAPHGESSGSITFRVADMLEAGGRPILDAMVMLLGAARLYGVAPERRLPAILADSRRYQANVTNELADQVFEALQILLRGFEAAAERDGRAVLDAAYARAGDHLYGGLLTQLLRLVFVLYAEDRGLLPVDSELYAEHLSLLGLFDELQADHGAHPDSMGRRFGAYGRLTALFRAIFLGAEHGDLKMPARRGQLFSPHDYPFLEGWAGAPGAAPIDDPAARAAVRVPSVDDDTVFRVLDKLLVLRRQRLSYRALDVEQIGSVYEALMGYHVVRLDAEAVCLRPARVWVTGEQIVAENPATRTKWLQEATGMARSQADKLNRALGAIKEPADVLDVLDDHAVAGGARRLRGSLVIQPGPERRRTSSHYTPRSLTAPVVARTLEPVVRALGDRPASDRLLSLKICDPAMGSGAFLVEACRYLADQVVLAWTRERRHDLLAGADDATLHARRLVAQRCLYGVDKNAYAVNLAKLSLWLVTLARDLPFTFVDHALRHGDSLVGLSFDQITAFHWRPAAQVELRHVALRSALDDALAARQRILELADDSSPAAQHGREQLLAGAEDALERVRLIGDLVIGAFFAADSERERERERERRLDLVLAWLGGGGPPPGELVALRGELRARVAAFHWMAEYPEVFSTRRSDPLDGGRTSELAWMDAFVGNPPFMGGGQVSGEFGEPYLDWLKTVHPGAHGNADLVAHFFRRAADLVGPHGAIGFIATNTIGQGDTRTTGPQYLLRSGMVIVDAVRSMPWPGEAAVSVAIVVLATARLAQPRTAATLDGSPVPAINSRLRSGPERPDPVPLVCNRSLAFNGAKTYGVGFLLDGAEREALIAKQARNAERIFPFLGGEDLTSSPEPGATRFAINFGTLTLQEAEAWPDLLAIVRERVKPERDRFDHNAVARRQKQYWWRYRSDTPELYAAVAAGGCRRVLALSRVTKYLALAWQPVDQIFGETVYVFALDRDEHFAVLQSRMHELWVRLLTSTMGHAGIRYSASDCFETFPFPGGDPRARFPDLGDIGGQIYRARAAYMRSHGQGLTQVYNLLRDPACDQPQILALRRLHEQLDRAVLTAYGWADLASSGIPPCTAPRTDAEQRAFTAFEDAVIDRLFELNAQRAPG